MLETAKKRRHSGSKSNKGKRIKLIRITGNRQG